MTKMNELEERRKTITGQMLSIRSMKRGTINEQYLKVFHQGKKEPVLRGPYRVLSRREGDKTVSVRLTSSSQLERAKRDTEAYQQFLQLCKGFESLTEKMGELQLQGEGGKKKQRMSSLSKTGK